MVAGSRRQHYCLLPDAHIRLQLVESRNVPTIPESVLIVRLSEVITMQNCDAKSGNFGILVQLSPMRADSTAAEGWPCQ
jgi:hypothetical protein